MSLQILTKNTVPPGGYRYTVPETGVKINSPSWDDLRNDVRKHYSANALAWPVDIDRQMEHQLCELMPPGVCQHDIFPTRGLHSGISFAQVMQGTATLWDWFKSGMEKVSQAEAQRRANICAPCPNNQDPQGCSTCNLNNLRNVIEQIVGGSKVQGDEFVRACSVCGCSLKAKIFLPLDVIQNNTPPDVNAAFPDFCWARRAV